MRIVDLQERMTQYIASQSGIFQRNYGYDFNFRTIKVNVEQVTLNGSGNIPLSADSWKKIIVTRPRGHNNPVIPCQIQAMKECEQVARITITDTIIKGLNEENSKIYLSLDHDDIPKEFGKHVEIDLCKGVFKKTESFTKSILSDEVYIGHSGAEAFVHSPLKEFIGNKTIKIF